MAEEIDEAGFYREDFSTESDFEVLNAQLGEVFQKWQLGEEKTHWGKQFERDELFKCKWRVQTEALQLLKQEIQVSFYAAQLSSPEDDCLLPSDDEMNPSPLLMDLVSVHNTFEPAVASADCKDLHPLARQFGLRRFVVLAPRAPHFLSSPAEFAFFRSAAAVVAAETGVTVPIFVQVYDPEWKFFVGVAVFDGGRHRTTFESIALEHSPADCRFLAGLLNMWKQKHADKENVRPPATVSVQKAYAMEEVRVWVPLRVPFGQHQDAGDNSDWLQESRFTALPHGYFPDNRCMVGELYTWPELADNICSDSALRTDFLPSKAPSGRLHFAHAGSGAYLSACLRDYQQLRDAAEHLEMYVGRNFSGVASAADVANPLDQLTGGTVPGMPRRLLPKSVFSSPQQSATLARLPGPMNANELQQMLVYLFPDQYPADVALFPYQSTAAAAAAFKKHRVKSAPEDSLVCRLSCLLATCNSYFGGKSGMAQLWAAFTRELRLHWERELPIPSVAPGFPDTRTGLLYQKMQMLNVCLDRHNSPSKSNTMHTAEPSAHERLLDDDEEDDEIFYDCAGPQATGSAAKTDAEFSPRGRQWRLGDKTLLNSELPLFVPLTQEPVSKTEDQLHDDAEVMLKLGPGSGLATQMMCASLRSDMEAFKAANPKAEMADFIRWYSPIDWVKTRDDNGAIVGKLSARMSAPDNTWQTMWQNSRPVPVWEQKRLFDETNEALKVLHYLETRTIGEIYELTIVPLLTSASTRIRNFYAAAEVEHIFDNQQIFGQLNRLANLEKSNFEPIISDIEKLEMQFYQFKCLERISSTKSDARERFAELVTNGGSYLNIRNTGQTEKFFSSKEEDLVSKDYVIRGGQAQRRPQFLRAIITGESIRLCGAFTENTAFI